MGASESHDDLEQLSTEMKDLQREGASPSLTSPHTSIANSSLQDSSYPWFHIIQWSCEEIQPEKVFKWDLSSIRTDVFMLTSDSETWLASCPKGERIANFTLDDTTTFVEWACVLLLQVPNLSAVRFNLVPSRLPEERFWERYFSAIRRIVRHHVVTDQDGEE